MILLAGKCNDRPVEETYQTMLNHKTVLVESIDCNDDDDDDIATCYRLPVV